MGDTSEELIATIRTKGGMFEADRPVGWDEAGHGGVGIYTISQRLAAADELANRRAIEALPALQELFVELATRSFFLDSHRSNLRRLAQAVVTLGGAEAFGGMILSQVVPAVDRVPQNYGWITDYEWGRKVERLSFLRAEFGTIGDWEPQVAKKMADEERARHEHASDESSRRAELERIRNELDALEALARSEPRIEADVQQRLPLLMRVIMDPGLSSSDRVRAIHAAGSLADTSLLPALQESFSDSDYKIREAAAEALSAFGAGAIATLVRFVDSAEWSVKTEAVKALKKIDHPEASRFLENLRATEQDYEVLKLLEEEPHHPVETPPVTRVRPVGRVKSLFRRRS